MERLQQQVRGEDQHGELSNSSFCLKTRRIQRSSNGLNVMSEQVEDHACLYEVGQTVLQYEEERPVVSAQGSSLHMFYRPLGESESSQTSDAGSRETGDSGNCSQDETDSSSPTRTSFRPHDPVQKQSQDTSVSS